jgi:hypothetical protein
VTLLNGVYIAGPMRGRPAYNFATFEAVDALVRKTWPHASVFNPAWNDIVKSGLVGTAMRHGWAVAGQHLLDRPAEFSLRDALKDDLTFICEHASTLVLLPGWRTSSGARTEVALAQALGLTIWWVDEALTEIQGPVTEGALAVLLRPGDEHLSDTVAAPAGEVRTTSRTGGEKGQKPERYDLIPWEAMDEVARVYGFGANKYAAHNWRRKYEWGKSIAALLRHVSLFVRGKTYDEETGLHHLAHAVFHCLALIVWTAEDGEGSEFDDRFRPDMFEQKDKDA